MNLRHTFACFFRNVADYFEPRFLASPPPSHAHEELRRQTSGNFTGKDWTPEEIQQRTIDYFKNELTEFEDIMKQLKSKEISLNLVKN